MPKAVAAGYPSLASLDVSADRKLTDEALEAVATCWPSLASRNTSGCEKLTDEAQKAGVNTAPAWQASSECVPESPTRCRRQRPELP